MEQVITQISTAQNVHQKIKRIAYEIAEDNYDESELIIAGICKNTEGYELAERIHYELKTISSAEIILTSIELDKLNPDNIPVEINLLNGQIDNKVIILVDDVANTGRTLLYAIKPFLNYSPKKIRIAVLVERKHKMFPISPDYVGLSLSTTFQEHIKVVLTNKEEEGIYLL
jgi:pyrimidine operon attenuation protein/uracil phosphoribosyltransferase